MAFKRAVSPLIATILLISMTISIGALLIGWGRQYVAQQIGGCLSIDMQVRSTTLGTNYINITAYNTGTAPIDINDMYIVAMAGTNTLTCLPGDPASVPNNGCVIDNTGETTINPSKEGYIVVYFGSGIDVGSVNSMEVYTKGCSKALALIVP